MHHPLLRAMRFKKVFAFLVVSDKMFPEKMSGIDLLEEGVANNEGICSHNNCVFQFFSCDFSF